MMNLKGLLRTASQISLYNAYDKRRNRSDFLKRKQRSVVAIQEYIQKSPIRNLQIGCGSNVLPGWLNTDLRDAPDVYYLDAGEPFSIPDNTFDFVYSEHIFEHLKVDQQINMIVESFRILKPGGILRIATPSSDFLQKLYSEPQSPEATRYINWAMDNIPALALAKEKVIDKENHYIYIINNFYKAWGHQVIHNSKSLKALAEQFGFVNVVDCAVGESSHSELQDIEKHGTIIPPDINVYETMILEFQKPS